VWGQAWTKHPRRSREGGDFFAIYPQAVGACSVPPAARVQPAVFPCKATTLSAGFRMRCARSAPQVPRMPVASLDVAPCAAP
jgi:hypothetical protein